jgi:hypothetical protein
MENFLQDLLFYGLLAWIAYKLLDGSSGGGKRDRAVNFA